jgi:hypothetical protein
VPKDEQIHRTDSKHYDRISVQPIKEPAPSGQRQKLAHGQRVDIAESAMIEIAGVRMVERVTVSPEIVGRQGQYANDASDPVIHATSAEECAVATIVLDHEEANEETGSRHGEQQVKPVTDAESGPHQNP